MLPIQTAPLCRSWPVDIYAEFSVSQAFTDEDGFYNVEMGVPVTSTFVSVSTYTFCNSGGNEWIEAPIFNGAASADFVVCNSPCSRTLLRLHYLYSERRILIRVSG